MNSCEKIVMEAFGALAYYCFPCYTEAAARNNTEKGNVNSICSYGSFAWVSVFPVSEFRCETGMGNAIHLEFLCNIMFPFFFLVWPSLYTNVILYF